MLSQVFSTFVYTEDVAFPSQYPTGCLLGCVDMVDCLSQEQYREKVGKILLDKTASIVAVKGSSNKKVNISQLLSFVLSTFIHSKTNMQY